MLKEIMQALDKGDVASTMQLAKILGVSEGLVAQMIQDLEHGGYLASLASGCTATSCQSCPFSKSCGSTAIAKMWVLTEKGRRAAQEETSKDLGN